METNYILNTSFMVDAKSHGQWYELMTSKFIPSLKEDSRFGKVTFSRVLSAEKATHYTYSLLLEMETLDGYHYFSGEAIGNYSEIATPMFGATVCHFITLMKPI